MVSSFQHAFGHNTEFPGTFLLQQGCRGPQIVPVDAAMADGVE
jgi:hypothetical protein